MRSSTLTENYTFSSDWITGKVKRWEQLIPRDIKQILEIGNFEGRSTIWFAQHCPQATITSVDPSNIGAKETLISNIDQCPNKGRINLIFQDSRKFLPTLPRNSMDFIYVDGSHKAEDVLLDGLNSWLLLKEDGILLFDDYEWEGNDMYGSPGFSGKLPKIGIDAFLSFQDCKIIHKGYQLAVQK